MSLIVNYDAIIMQDTLTFILSCRYRQPGPPIYGSLTAEPSKNTDCVWETVELFQFESIYMSLKSPIWKPC